MKKSSFKTLLAASVCALLFACSASMHTVSSKPDGGVVARTESPFTDAVWVENEYRWDGNTYIVVPAHWEKSRGTWVPGYWKETSGGYTWVPGHWK